MLIVGDAAFMNRYGFEFDDDTKDSSQWATLCISFDGKMSAKATVRYNIEPLFEMLIERLSENGISCAVETYDPLICSKLVERLRRFGNTPVSIVHKTAKDIYRGQNGRDSKKEDTGLIVKASRLKLAEAVIWCKKLLSIRKKIAAMSVAGGIIAFLFAVTLNLLDAVQWTNQYILLAFRAIWIALILAFAIFEMPKKNYFSRSAIERKNKNKKQKKRKKNL